MPQMLSAAASEQHSAPLPWQLCKPPNWEAVQVSMQQCFNPNRNTHPGISWDASLHTPARQQQAAWQGSILGGAAHKGLQQRSHCECSNAHAGAELLGDGQHSAGKAHHFAPRQPVWAFLPPGVEACGVRATKHLILCSNKQ